MSTPRLAARLVSLAGLLLAAAPASARRLPPPAPGAPAIPPPATAGWSATAVGLRGQNGTQVVYDCPARGRAGSVWGTDVYTDDSSVCTAAVHQGLITLAAGGQVVIEIRAGEPGYPGSARNGITSAGWGAWTGSFVIVGAAANPGVAPGGPTPVDWNDSAQQFAGGGGPITVDCPAGGIAGSVWGSGIYTDDSSICTAAVHAGVIGFAGGGVVDIELRPGEPGYPASTSNGVTSSSWGAWSGSFVVLGGAAATAPQLAFAGPLPIDWSENATAYRGRIGQRFDLACPGGGSPGAVWGDGVYTDDSSICTAAVHAGVISAAAGGPVTIEILAGQPGYRASAANGVTTLPYGSWTGSYRFR